MVNNIGWGEFKKASHLREYSKFPLDKIARKLHLIQEIKDVETREVHYVSRRAFKKWSNSEGLDLFKPTVTMDQIRTAIQMRNSGQISFILQNLKFPAGLTSAQKKWIRETIEKELPEGITKVTSRTITDPSAPKNQLRISWNAKGVVSSILWNGQPLRWKADQVALRWPENLPALKLTKGEMRSIDEYVTHQFSTWNNFTQSLIISKKESGLPVSLCIVPDHQGKVARVIMLLGEERVGLIGRGGERKVKHAFDLLHGTKLAKKEIQTEVEKSAQRKAKGPEIWASGAKGTKQFVFEEVYAGSLDKMLTQPLSDQQIEGMARDLLKQLAAFHSKPGERGIPSFHGDIKPANILWRMNDEDKMEVVISDFGAANISRGFGGTRAFLSPELVEVLATPGLEYERKTILMDYFRKEHAQNADVWAMGLTFLQLLTEGKLLKSIDQATASSFIEKIRIAMKKLNQAQINLELNELQKLHHPDSVVWDLVKKMLVINPLERHSASSLINSI